MKVSSLGPFGQSPPAAQVVAKPFVSAMSFARMDTFARGEISGRQAAKGWLLGRRAAQGRLLGRRAAKVRQLGRRAAKDLLLGRRAAHGVSRHDAVSRLSGWWILRRERGKRGEGTS